MSVHPTDTLAMRSSLLPVALRWVACLIGVGALAGDAVALAAQPASLPDAPTYVQRQWTVEEGLPVNAVNAIRQGPRGYLWMTTYDGLVRFDGKEWTVYRSATEPALPGNRFRELVKGANGLLWATLESGELVRVDPRTEQFRVLAPDASPLPGAVTTLRPDGDRLWVGTTRGLAVIRKDTLRRTPLDSTLTVQHVAPGSGARLWIGTDRGVYELRDGTTARVPTVAGPVRPDARHLQWTGNRLWVATLDGVYTLRDGFLHRPFSGAPDPTSRSAIYAHEDSTGTLWVGTNDPTARGLYVRRDGRLRSYEAADFGRGSGVRMGPRGHRWILAGNVLYRDGRRVLSVDGRLRDLFFDREGNVWAATSRDGVYRLRSSPFTIYGRPEGLASGNVYPVYEARSDPGTIWMGTLGGGLARLRDGSVRVFGPDAGVPGIVWALHEDQAGRLWVGGESDLCFFQDGRCQKQGLPDALANRREVRALYEDEQGRLWVGTDGHGLYRRQAGTWTHLAPEIPARVIEQTRNGSLWMGTDGRGLFRYRNGQFDRVGPEEGLSSDLIRAIHEDTTGALWIGTEDKGVNRIDRRGTPSLVDDSIAVIRKRDGLFDNVISQILPDGHGRLWMSSNRGLFWVRRDSLHAVADGRAKQVHSVSYTEAEGLRNREANGGMQPAGLRAASGALWFPTQEGAVRVDPADLGTDAPLPTVVVERVRTDSAAYRAAGSVRLPVGTRNFTVTFAGLHFANPDALTFHYRLRGFAEQGPKGTEQRRVSYTSLPPGRYTFEVRARTDRGAWSPAAATVRVVVPPHWWETDWFYALCAVGLVGVGIGAYRWRVRRLRQRQAELEATVDERTEEVRRQRDQLEEQARRLQALDEAKSRFFANLSHEFRTPLTLIQGPVRAVRDALRRGTLEPSDGLDQLAIAERNTARLQRLIEQILGLARLESGSYELNARPTALTDAVPTIVRRFEPLAERHGLALTVRTEDTGSADGAEPDPAYVDREALKHVVSNLLSNAIKFTPAGGTVAVTVTERADAVGVTVADTGPGIPEDQRDAVFDRFQRAADAGDRTGTGIGLAFTNDLVELHGGTVALDSTEGEGTTVTVRFRRGRDHLADDQTAAPRPSGPASPSDPPKLNASPSPLNSQSSSSPSERVSPPDPDSTPTEHSHNAPNDQSKIVLVVDDNADVRRYVRSVLAPEFDVIEAADGAEGLDVARERLPDVILADVMMPEMDGHEMTRRLKDAPETEAIPVLMVTARAETSDEVTGLQAGADDYVTKPFDADVLRQRVAGMIAVRRRLRRRIRAELARRRGDGSAEDQTGGDQTWDTAPPRLVVPTATEDEPDFVREVRAAIEERLADPDLSVEQLASAVAVSRSTLYRRLKAQADATPSQFVRQVRIEHGARLLREQEGTVSEVAYAVGFESLSYFSRQFREQFGQSPSEYVEAVG